MDACPVCHSSHSREDTVEEVFHIGDDYVLVRGIPAKVCKRCGEMTFSAETVESVRLAARGDAVPRDFKPLKVIEFAR